jgi:hypothetical protein
MNRWLFGKLSTRSRSHFTTSYHLTSTIGGFADPAIPTTQFSKKPPASRAARRKKGKKSQRATSYAGRFLLRSIAATAMPSRLTVAGSGISVVTGGPARRKPISLNSSDGSVMFRYEADREDAS